MPKSLEAIEKAADLLEQACKDMKRDPYSKAGRDRLIAGSRGILQGTTAMLVFFDESQVNVKRLNSATIFICWFENSAQISNEISLWLNVQMEIENTVLAA